MIAKLLYSVRHSYTDALAAGDDRPMLPRALRQALEAIESSPELLTASDLARHAGVGVRRLEQTFRAHLGTTPGAYLTQFRLRRAHEDLCRAAPGESVTAVMHRWGFGNPGRFATLYRARYGRYPVETLRHGA